MVAVEALPKDCFYHSLLICQITNMVVIPPGPWQSTNQPAFPFHAWHCPHPNRFAHREGCKWSFTAPCFVQEMWLWTDGDLIKTFVQKHVEGESSVVVCTWTAVTFAITLAATKISWASSPSREQGDQSRGQEETLFLRATMVALQFQCLSFKARSLQQIKL